MTTKTLVASFASLLLLSGCGIARNLTASFPVPPSITLHSIAPTTGVYLEPPGDNPQGFIVRSEDDLRNAFDTRISESMTEIARINYLDGLVSTLPTIDFTKEQGVLFLFGSVGSAGYEGKIASIEEKSDRFLVHPILWSPPPGRAVPAAICYPYHYIAMPRSEKPVEFAPMERRQEPGPWYAIFSTQ